MTKIQINARGKLLICTDEGYLAAFDVMSGRRGWQKFDLGELRWKPTTDGKSVFLAVPPTNSDPATLRSFNLKTGLRGKFFKFKKGVVWSTPPSVINDVIMVGTRNGVFYALELDTMKPRYFIRGKGAASAPAHAIVKGGVICLFEGGEGLVFPEKR